jgi:AsmA family protein
LVIQHQPDPPGRWRRLEHGVADRARATWRRLSDAARRGPRETPSTAAPRRRRVLRALAWTGGGLLVLAAGLVTFLVLFDWNQARGPIGRIASDRLHRPVALNGELDVRIWSLTPGATVRGLTIANPPWAGREAMAEIERLDVKVKLLPLIKGDVVLPLVDVTKPRVRLLRAADGRANWDFSDGRKREQPMRLPPIQHFIIRDGELDIVDRGRGLTFHGTVTASEQRGAASQGFRLLGQGRLNQRPFFARITGGPLVNVRTDRPYPFDAEVRAGDTRVVAKGAVPKPFDLGRYHADLNLRGGDLADLYYLTGLTLPNTPPYRLAGRLSRQQQLYRFDGFSGRVGDSDVAGHFSVDASGERPFLRGQAHSRRLDFDDLATVLGGAPSTAPGETASPEQKLVARQMAASQRLLPDATLDVKRIRAMDADFRYRAQSVQAAPNLPWACSGDS